MADVFRANVYPGSSVPGPLFVFVLPGNLRTIDGVEYVETSSGHFQVRNEQWRPSREHALLDAAAVVGEASRALADQAARLMRGEN